MTESTDTDETRQIANVPKPGNGPTVGEVEKSLAGINERMEQNKLDLAAKSASSVDPDAANAATMIHYCRDFDGNEIHVGDPVESLDGTILGPVLDYAGSPDRIRMACTLGGWIPSAHVRKTDAATAVKLLVSGAVSEYDLLDSIGTDHLASPVEDESYEPSPLDELLVTAMRRSRDEFQQVKDVLHTLVAPVPIDGILSHTVTDSAPVEAIQQVEDAVSESSSATPSPIIGTFVAGDKQEGWARFKVSTFAGLAIGDTVEIRTVAEGSSAASMDELQTRLVAAETELSMFKTIAERLEMELDDLARNFTRLSASVDYDIHARLMNPRSRTADARLAAGDPFDAEKCMEILGIKDHPLELARSLTDSWKDDRIAELEAENAKLRAVVDPLKKWLGAVRSVECDVDSAVSRYQVIMKFGTMTATQEMRKVLANVSAPSKPIAAMDVEPAVDSAGVVCETQSAQTDKYEDLLSAARIVTGLNEWLDRDDVSDIAWLEWSPDGSVVIRVAGYVVDDYHDTNEAMTLAECKEELRRHVRSLRSIGDEAMEGGAEQ